jgi:inosose dehydratase
MREAKRENSIDPAALFAKSGTRTSYVNFKDISGSVLDHSRENALPFLTAVDQGVFCCLGDGVVDFSGFCRELKDARFSGPAVIERDRSPATFSSALDDARRVIRFIKECGLAFV